MGFSQLRETTRVVVVGEGGGTRRVVRSPEKIAALVGFAEGHALGWSRPLYVAPVQLRADFFSGDHYLGGLGLGDGFLSAQGCGEFQSLTLNEAVRRRFLGLVEAEDPSKSLHEAWSYALWSSPGNYKAARLIRAVVELQSLDRESAMRQMRAMAVGPEGDEVVLLARMMFDAAPHSALRPPGLGGAMFLGKTHYADWPRDPIEIVNGIPFLIVDGYFLAGLPEAPIAYLEYCHLYGDWTSHRYRVTTMAERRQALNKLLKSPKWKAPLTVAERQFLEQQID